jgi:uncharacterized membrane protein YbhN (UPF0104 family)
MAPDPKAAKPGGIKRALSVLPTLLGLALLSCAVFVMWREFHGLKPSEIGRAVRQIPLHALALAAVWTFFAYFVLIFYDRLGTIYAGHKISYRRAAFASFCAYALSHNLGLAAVSGAAVRYRLYSHWGLLPPQIAKVVAFCSLTFGLGAGVLFGAVLWVEPQSLPFIGKLAPVWVLHAAGTLCWLIVALYVSLARFVRHFRLFGQAIELPRWYMALGQVTLATVDVAATASIFHALLPHASGLTWMQFIGVYLASYSAGLIANLPGGLGVFDGAMLLGLAPWLDAPHVLSAILIYRLFYYIIPLFIAGSLFAGNEIALRGGSFWRRFRGVPAEARVSSWSEPDFAVAAASGAVAMSGTLLLAVGVLLPRPEFTWVGADFAEVAAEAGQYVPSLAGAGLLALTMGLWRRVNLAWGLTLLLLAIGTLFEMAQGVRLWVPVTLLLTVMLVAPFRGAFYRHARLFAGPLTVENVLPMLALLGCIVTLAALEKHVRNYADNMWWELVISPEVPNGLRASVALAVLVGALAMWRLVHPGRVSFLPWTPETSLRFARMGGAAPSYADGMVVGESGQAAIAFRRCGKILLALGDPVGAGADMPAAVWRFRDLAQQEGRDPAVWRAGAALLKLYADLGLTALPLGPDGMPVSDEPVGPGMVSRLYGYLVCVVERDMPVLLPMIPALMACEARAPAGE